MNALNNHLLAAGEIIHATARATVADTPDASSVLSRIDAAQSFVHAADYLYDAADRIASGAAPDDAKLAEFLHYARSLLRKGEDQVAGKKFQDGFDDADEGGQGNMCSSVDGLGDIAFLLGKGLVEIVRSRSN